MNKKRCIKFCFGVLCSFLILLCGAVLIFWNSYLHLDFVNVDSLGAKLNSSDAEVLRETLAIMKRKGATNEINRAIELLTNKDDYVWLAAAHYLGRNGVSNSVPYLIKSLRHTAYRGDAETLQYLREMTGVKNGEDFYSWYLWWSENNKTEGFDWNLQLGPRPRLSVVKTQRGE